MRETHWRIYVHNYAGYTHGCRCDACRRGKADYMRGKRAKHARTRRLVHTTGSGGRNFVAGIKHGYAAYQDLHCRCDVCRKAKLLADRRQKADVR